MFGAFAGAQALPEPVCIAVLAINILLLNYLYKKKGEELNHERGENQTV